jgi:hypothetical protein
MRTPRIFHSHHRVMVPEDIYGRRIRISWQNIRDSSGQYAGRQASYYAHEHAYGWHHFRRHGLGKRYWKIENLKGE